MKGHLTTLNVNQLRIDANSSQSVISNDYQKGNITVTDDRFNLTNGEA